MSLMRPFSDDNTDGYTEEQLKRANDKVQQWFADKGVDRNDLYCLPWIADEYKRVQEKALEEVE